MRLRVIAASLAVLFLTAGVAYAAAKFTAQAVEFDPGKTFLVQAEWLDGIGCPTGAHLATPNAAFTDFVGTVPFTDPTCPTGDQSDRHNQGLLLAKTGPSSTNFAAATARLGGVEGITLTELGYDLRKPKSADDPRGSHCGSGAPRFNVTTTDGFWFLACNSPPAVATTAADSGWLRLRWAGTGLVGFKPGAQSASPITGKVKSISIVFDEGQDTGPDNFGLTVIDNIDVNGTLIGHGENTRAKDKDRHEDDDKDKHDDDEDDDD